MSEEPDQLKYQQLMSLDSFADAGMIARL